MGCSISRSVFGPPEDGTEHPQRRRTTIAPLGPVPACRTSLDVQWTGGGVLVNDQGPRPSQLPFCILPQLSAVRNAPLDLLSFHL